MFLHNIDGIIIGSIGPRLIVKQPYPRTPGPHTQRTPEPWTRHTPKGTSHRKKSISNSHCKSRGLNVLLGRMAWHRFERRASFTRCQRRLGNGQLMPQQLFGSLNLFPTEKSSARIGIAQIALRWTEGENAAFMEKISNNPLSCLN